MSNVWLGLVSKMISTMAQLDIARCSEFMMNSTGSIPPSLYW